MGFGSYDESEQERQEVNVNDSENDKNKEANERKDFEGEVEYTNADTESLLDTYQDVKQKQDSE